MYKKYLLLITFFVSGCLSKKILDQEYFVGYDDGFYNAWHSSAICLGIDYENASDCFEKIYANHVSEKNKEE